MLAIAELAEVGTTAEIEAVALAFFEKHCIGMGAQTFLKLEARTAYILLAGKVHTLRDLRGDLVKFKVQKGESNG